MRDFLRKVDANFEPMMIIGIFYALLVLLVVQIFLRRFAQGGFPWAEEVCRFMFVWLMYFCISYATRNQRHIKVRFFVQLFNERMQKLFELFTDILFLGFSIVMLTATIRLVQQTAQYGDRAISLNVSMNVLYVAGLIGFILMALRVLQGIWWKLKNWNESLERFQNVFGVYYDNSILLPLIRDNSASAETPEQKRGDEDQW